MGFPQISLLLPSRPLDAKSLFPTLLSRQGRGTAPTAETRHGAKTLVGCPFLSLRLCRNGTGQAEPLGKNGDHLQRLQLRRRERAVGRLGSASARKSPWRFAGQPTLRRSLQEDRAVECAPRAGAIGFMDEAISAPRQLPSGNALVARPISSCQSWPSAPPPLAKAGPAYCPRFAFLGPPPPAWREEGKEAQAKGGTMCEPDKGR